ncbi:hypothetical protein KKJ25_21360, partial [Xenorhabdus bovienii]|nr:hypothetical protein [Xenorhabdus bovienii]MDE9475375.1 hypothetical protein [Xenorhabdus bovienii]
MPFDNLETERLLLRKLAYDDATQIQQKFPHWEVVKYLDSLDSPNKCNFSEGRSVAIVGIFLAKGKCTMAYTQLTEIERYQIFSLKEAG